MSPAKKEEKEIAEVHHISQSSVICILIFIISPRNVKGKMAVTAALIVLIPVLE
jgi:hypothetical protein